MSKYRIAVTGATGFVGWHVVQSLQQHECEVVAVARASSDTARLRRHHVCVRAAELSDVAALAAAFADCDAAIHLASAVDFAGDWGRFRTVNVHGTANVIAAARLAGLKRIVHCSTIAAVGAAQRPIKLNESATWNLGQLRVPYITTKREAEVLALAANDASLQVVVVNPGCVIGPDDFAASEFGVMCRRFWRGNLPIHFGGGNSFVDVRDVAAGIAAACRLGRPAHRYILAGANRSMSAFFTELARAARMPIPRLRLPSALGPIMAHLEQSWSRKSRPRKYLTPAQARLLDWYFYFDSGKAERELGFTRRPLRQTLADAFAYWERRRAA